MNFRKTMKQVREMRDAGDITGLQKIRNKAKQGGFTLLELLVVVAILAAIAGTATIALQDTDARASAAAHVAMMDELNKGIRTYRVLQRNSYPSRFDSLLEVDTAALDNPAKLSIVQVDDLDIKTLTSAQFSRLGEVGLDQLAYVAKDQDPADEGSCTDVANLIGSRQNAVVAGNIFLSANANGCGVFATAGEVTSTTQDAQGNDVDTVHPYTVSSQADGANTVTVTNAASNATLPIAVWAGGAERLTGQAEDASKYDAENNTVFLATGVGPASTLFKANDLGAMTSVPVYRHVGPEDYNRFIAIWDIGTYDDSTDIVVKDQPNLVTIVDGAGDTKEEELGEWDGSRNTI